MAFGGILPTSIACFINSAPDLPSIVLLTNSFKAKGAGFFLFAPSLINLLTISSAS